MYIEFLPRPEGVAREFAWRLMEDEADESPIMAGDGQRWSLFTRRQMRRARDEFVVENRVPPDDAATIDSWIASLPWEPRQDGLEPYIGDDPEDEVGVELYFNA